MFSNDGAIAIVMEVTTDCFVHMNFGFVSKIGTWVGLGAFAAGVGQDVQVNGWSNMATPSDLWGANWYMLNALITNNTYNGGNRVTNGSYGGVIDINGKSAAFTSANQSNPFNNPLRNQCSSQNTKKKKARSISNKQIGPCGGW